MHDVSQDFKTEDLTFEAACRQETDNLHVIQIHPTLQCNLKCKHCYSSSGPQFRNRVDLTALGRFMEYAREFGFNVMSVSGGEPFIYPELEPMLSMSHANGYRNMAASNAMLFNTDRAKRCLKNLDLIAISIDGDENVHDEIRDFPGAFNKMLEGVEIARQSGILFGFIHTITSESWEKLLWLGDFAYEEGAQLLQLHPLELTGRAILEFNELIPSQESLHKVHILASYLQQKYEDRMHIHMDFFHRKLVLDSPRSISWYGNDFELTRENFAQVLRSLIVDQDGNIFPLSYGFSENFMIGNINETKEGRNIFQDFIESKGKELYSLFGQTFQEIESDTDTDMITWTEMIVKQSNKKHSLRLR